ncbi:MAG: hypothetical protein LBG59_01615 [Candidatus Peribacteria bacterium]|jgi:hypothetical protein|nr:hypothetical protein [Candidatus Peribacteria bacterium]
MYPFQILQQLNGTDRSFTQFKAGKVDFGFLFTESESFKQGGEAGQFNANREEYYF